MVISIVVAVFLVVIDQITKYIALTNLKPVGNITFIEGFMDFTFVENRGAAFGILSGKIWILLVLAIGICVALIVAMKKMPKTKEYSYLKAALTLILAGAVGNIIDRLVRGYVVDFFEFTFFRWPVFNMADVYVVLGTIAMAFIVLFVIKDDEEKEKKITKNGGSEDAGK